MEESSVLFNLREIMRLEHERIDAETAAIRTARERAAREQAEREQQAEHARQRAQQALREQEEARAAAAADAERERAEALLRVRLDAEARERDAHAAAERAHARELQALAQRRSARIVWVALGTVLITGVSGYAALAPRWRAAATQRAELERRAALTANEAEALRRELSELRARHTAAATAPATAAEPGTAITPNARPSAQSPRPVRVPPTGKPATKVEPRDRAASALDGIDRPDDDPIGELFNDAEPTPRRARR